LPINLVTSLLWWTDRSFVRLSFSF